MEVDFSSHNHIQHMNRKMEKALDARLREIIDDVDMHRCLAVDAVLALRAEVLASYWRGKTEKRRP